MDQQDGSGQAWRWNLGIEKWVTRPHASARGTQAAGEERRVDDYFPTGFPPTCRSVSCALEFEVVGRRRAGRKKSLAARRSNGGGEGFRKENKVTGRKHGHRKRN